MRVTNRMMGQILTSNIQRNLEALARSQNGISTGKRVLKPSDDTSQISLLMVTKAVIQDNEQYMVNINDGMSFLEHADVTLSSVSATLNTVRELTVQAASDTYTASDRVAIAAQVDRLVDNIVDLANATVGGKYVFAGTLNGVKPFERVGDSVYYLGNLEMVQREILPASSYEIGVPPVQLTALAQKDPLDGLSKLTDQGASNLQALLLEKSGQLVNDRLVIKHGNGYLDVTLKNTIEYVKTNPAAGVSLEELRTKVQSDITEAINQYNQAAGQAGKIDPVQVEIASDGTRLKFTGNNIEFVRNTAFHIFTADGSSGVFGVATYDPVARRYLLQEQNGGLLPELIRLKNALQINDKDGIQKGLKNIFSSDMGSLSAHDNLLAYQVKLGAREKHFESVSTTLQDLNYRLNITEQNIEDEDIAKASVIFSQKQLAYQASLATGAQILQTTLLQFLK
ncbi:MAG: flagellar hook-associated protein FlgL [Desulfurispora sp.]|uniref:flagellar hook-associated protein FlgL n=1 Tax=Desulfurispora sp. TaxID=3014275 RepID=UPI004049BF6A